MKKELEKEQPEKCEGKIATVTICHSASPPSKLSAEATNTTGEATFDGPYFVCQLVGHRAAECPKRICYSCRQTGHLVRECPMRVVVGGIVCQGCGTAGNALRECPQPNSRHIVAMLENGGYRDAAKPPAFFAALIETQESDGIIGMVVHGVEPRSSGDRDRISVKSCNESRGEPRLVA